MPRPAAQLLTTSAARDSFAEVLNRAAYGKERVVLTRRGKPLVAVVPIEDVILLEGLDDERDSALIRERVAEWEAAGRPGGSRIVAKCTAAAAARALDPAKETANDDRT